jgi:hypothetical protein
MDAKSTSHMEKQGNGTALLFISIALPTRPLVLEICVFADLTFPTLP